MENVLFILLFILSRSPLLSITLDEKFHEISNRDFKVEDLRYSLLSLGFGIVKVYLVTFKKGEKLKFIKILKFNDIQKIPNENEIVDKCQAYREHIESSKKSDIDIEVDFLKYKINQQENRKNIAINKMNNYTAIMLVVVPLMVSSLIKNLDNVSNILQILCLLIIIYSTFNIIIYILNFYRVKGFERSLFKDLKFSINRYNKSSEMYYSDWYSIKAEASSFVAYVASVERYLKYVSLTLLILLFSFSNTYSVCNSIFKKKFIKQEIGNSSYNIHFNQNGRINNEDLKKLSDIYSILSKGKVKQVIILKNIPKNNNIKEEYKKVYNSISIYDNQINIIEIDDINTNEENLSLIKILLLGGK